VVSGIHNRLLGDVGHLVFSGNPESQAAEDGLKVGASGPCGGRKWFSHFLFP